MIALLRRQLLRHLPEPVMLVHALLGFGPEFEGAAPLILRAPVWDRLLSWRVWL